VDGKLKMPVALELFPHDREGYDERAIVELFRGIASASELRHPNVVGCLDLGRREEYDFAVYELVDGGSVRTLIESKGQLDVEEALRLTADVLRGLAAGHKAAMSHGSLCPDNILLDYDGAAKLARFARPLLPGEFDECVPTPGGGLSCPCFYAAPEREGAAAAATPSTDLYSLGVVMYEMLAGHVPFDGENAEQIMALHRDSAAQDLRLVRPDCPEEVSDFVARLMAKRPGERPADGAAALEELNTVAETMADRRKARRAERKAAAKPVYARLQAVGWSALAIVLIALALIPMMKRFGTDRDEERFADQLARQTSTNHRVLIRIRAADEAHGDELAEPTRSAVATLAAARLSSCPPLQPVDPFAAAETFAAGKGMDYMLLKADPAYVLEMTCHPQPGGAEWEMSMAAVRGSRWSVKREGVVAGEDWPGVLGGGLQGLLTDAATHLKVDPPAPDWQALGAADRPERELWAGFAGAQAAERGGKWREARAALATNGSSPPPVFRTLDAFFELAQVWEEGGRLAELRDIPQEGLWGEFTFLANALSKIGKGAPEQTRKALAQYLAAYPQSARGQYLLAMWRASNDESTEEALAALEHAMELDPGYLPAALAAARLLAPRGQEALSQLVERYRKLALTPSKVEALEERCRQ